MKIITVFLLLSGKRFAVRELSFIKRKIDLQKYIGMKQTVKEKE